MTRRVVPAALAAAGLVAAGWSWVRLIRQHARQAEIIEDLKNLQDHGPCLDVMARMWIDQVTELDAQQGYIDHLEAKLDGAEDPDEEFRELIEGSGS